MDRLPTDVFILIIEQLDRKDRWNLGLSCRIARTNTIPFVFDIIKIGFNSSVTLKLCLDATKRFVEAAEIGRYVRHLKVTNDGLLSYEAYSYMMSSGTSSQHTSTLSSEEYMESSKTKLSTWTGDPLWLDLQELITCYFTGLKTVTWSCSEQIPLRILRCLPQSPSCQLHMDKFSLSEMLPYYTPNKSGLTELGHAIVRSPCLVRVYASVPTSWRNDYVETILFEMASGVTPNLREVIIDSHDDDYDTYLDDMDSVAYDNWPKGVVRPLDFSGIGKLENLELRGIRKYRLRNWVTMTDPSCLKGISDRQGSTTDDIEWMINNCKFTNLQNLSCCVRGAHDMRFRDFLISLPPLNSLDLRSHLAKIYFTDVITQRGSDLVNLEYILEGSDAELVSKLAQHCPKLQRLRLKIRRRSGSAREAAIYQALGTMPCLTHVDLTLEPNLLMTQAVARPGPPDEETLDSMDVALKDCAVDGDLARSIYQMIASTKAGHSASLLELNIRVTHISSRYLTFDMVAFLNMIARFWSCKHDPARHAKGECTVEPLSSLGWGKYSPDSFVEHGLLKSLYDSHEGCIQRAWPKYKEEAIWKHWPSFPLNYSGKDIYPIRRITAASIDN